MGQAIGNGQYPDSAPGKSNRGSNFGYLAFHWHPDPDWRKEGEMEGGEAQLI